MWNDWSGPCLVSFQLSFTFEEKKPQLLWIKIQRNSKGQNRFLMKGFHIKSVWYSTLIISNSSQSEFKSKNTFLICTVNLILNSFLKMNFWSLNKFLRKYTECEIYIWYVLYTASFFCYIVPLLFSPCSDLVTRVTTRQPRRSSQNFRRHNTWPMSRRCLLIGRPSQLSPMAGLVY